MASAGKVVVRITAEADGLTRVRTCRVCDETKALTEFIRCDRSRGGRTKECKSCATARAREWRQRHEGGYVPPSVAERLAIVAEARSRPCMDCGQQLHPAVMEFDHVRGEKKANVAALIHGTTTRQLLEEIEKCDVVCANCHCLRHWRINNPEG